MLAPAAVEVDIHAHIGLVERIEQFSDRPLAPAAAEIGAKMIMRVDHREAWSHDLRHRDAEPGPGQELVQVQIAFHHSASLSIYDCRLEITHQASRIGQLV